MADYSANYLLFNAEQTKNLAVVVAIDGIDYLSTIPIFTKLRYGDPGIHYGDPGLVFGGLRSVTNSQSLLSLEGSSLTLTQTIEPEQGRGSISTISFAFIDKDQYMSQVISPGVIIDEILGREVIVYLGYTQLSFPEEYTVIFRGRVSAVSSDPGKVYIQLSDPNVKRKENLFVPGTTKLNGAINNSVTTINVVGNGSFFQQILGPNGGYDSAITTYLKIDDEFILYPATGFGTNQFTSCVRGQRGTTAAAHDDGADVAAVIQIQDHGIDMALKLMLSGWNGNWLTGVPILNIVTTGDGTLLDQPGAVILPDKVDAVRDYGLVAGDYVSITGDSHGANNITSTIVRFADLFGQSNRIIYLNTTALVPSVMSAGVLAFRSQYDTYPVLCGSQLTPKDVDIAQHLFIKNTFLLASSNNLNFLIDAQESGKTFIESEVYLPLACYSLTRFGKLSVGFTKPPIADQRLQFITKDNLINPTGIKIQRATNNRKFFNEIDWAWDYDDNGNPTSTLAVIDSTSLTLIGLTFALPINSKGSRTSLGSDTQFSKRSQFLLQRYSRGAAMLDITVNWQVGSLIEAGDVVALQDNGDLQITNFNTGERDLGVQLYEVINRALDMGSGNVRLQLLAGVGATAIDKFATISPSSVVASGSTTTGIKIQDSFGAVFPGDESAKWIDYIGQTIYIHNENYTTSQSTTLIGISPSDNYLLEVDPPITPPPAGYIVDIPIYPASIDPNLDQVYKIIHAHFDPRVTITGGTSSTVFTVGAGDISKFLVGAIVIVHDTPFTVTSPEVHVQSVDTGTNTITVDSSLGFTPSSGYEVDLIGFADGGQPYRWI